ncbi:MAG: hypothetical protein H6732_10470 [Alphaproteobacteria bacterium]|nr:hypothetical protein [Alphaproteobacteria bacterium]
MTDDPSLLPPRTSEAEDAFVAGWADGIAEGDLPAVIDAALAAGRVALAARLVGLVEGDEDDEAWARARRAAQLVLHRQLGPEDVSWSELQDAWREVRRRRMRRARLRQRAVIASSDGRIGRLTDRDERTGDLPRLPGRRRR